MALDFYLAENQRALERGEVIHAFALEEEIHTRLFAFDEAEFPLLRRLEDFYRDARFSGSSLSALRAEVRAVHSRVPDLEVQQFLSMLAKTCERADREGKILLVRCD